MKDLFGFVIVIIIFVAYVGIWGTMIVDVFVQKDIFGKGDDYAFTVAGLVSGVASALAISVLGTTPAGSAPDIRNVIPAKGGNPREALTAIYLLSWLLIGAGTTVAAFCKDVVPNTTTPTRVISELRSFSEIWVGMAVSGALVYFGINRPS